jgi:alpha-L-rhamnosidase
MATLQYIPACFYARSVEILADVAAVLNNKEDAQIYTDLHQKIKEAFIAEYISEAGELIVNMQGFHVLALHFKLVPEKFKQKVVDRLVFLIEENGNRLDTGFVSVPYLLDVLVENGHANKAWAILYQQDCPSWLYQVKQGATTVWETWQAIQPSGKVTTSSFNHYAYGCVGDWMYRNIAGIIPTAPGYKEFLIKPLVGSGLTSAKGEFNAVYGKITSEWVQTSKGTNYKVSVPVGCKAKIVLPHMETTVGSGEYEFIGGF